MAHAEPSGQGASTKAGDPFQQPVIASRWLFATGIFVETLLQVVRGGLSESAKIALTVLCIYNVLALVGVHRIPRRRLPGALMLALDLTLVGIAAYYTNASRSPLLGQCYLVIFSGALLYGIPGGVATGAASSLLALYLALHSPGGARSGLQEDVRDLIPYFLIAGGFTGYLSQRLRAAFRSAREAAVVEQRLRFEEETLQRELEMARRMQVSALPTVPPQFPGVSIGIHWEFAREVGGDFFFYLTEQDRLGLVLGDVSGKGMAAALIATSIGYLLPWLRPLQDPPGALSNLNRDLAARLPSAAFVTLTLAEVYPERNRIRLWSAGHPPCLLWSARERTVHAVEAPGPLLGVLPSWDGRSQEGPFVSGDVLVLYSDGLIETRNAAGEMFDTCGAAQALRQCAGGTADEIAAALAAAAKAFGTPTDDLTILVCKRE